MGLRNTIKRWSEEGFRPPMIHDPITKLPSITLTFPYVSFFIALAGVVLLLRENTLYGAIAAISMWLIALVLYLMRRLTKFKADLNDTSLELESDEESDEPSKTSN